MDNFYILYKCKQTKKEFKKMSCYIVEKKTIDNLVWGFTHFVEDYKYNNLSADEIGKKLIQLNTLSYVKRYRHCGEKVSDYLELKKEYQFENTHPSLLQLVQSCECYLYQSCECGMDTSQLYNLVVCLLSYTTRKIVNSLPEMQNLPWE